VKGTKIVCTPIIFKEARPKRGNGNKSSRVDDRDRYVSHCYSYREIAFGKKEKVSWKRLHVISAAQVSFSRNSRKPVNP
jgi:hypothetical protein